MSGIKFNILLLANTGFMYCAKVFLNSLFYNVNLEKIDTVYIGDIGLDAESLKYLERYTKVKILDAPSKIDFDGFHTENWVTGVAQKTLLLKQLVEQDKLPLLMIDADSLVTRDFSYLLDTDHDILVCRRLNPAPDGHGNIMNYIGSFLFVKNSKALPFIEDWIKEMLQAAKTRTPPYETPALCRTILAESGSTSLGWIGDHIVSCTTEYDPKTTHIIHMKSTSSSNTDSFTNFMDRVEALKGLPIQSVLQYLLLPEKCVQGTE